MSLYERLINMMIDKKCILLVKQMIWNDCSLSYNEKLYYLGKIDYMERANNLMNICKIVTLLSATSTKERRKTL